MAHGRHARRPDRRRACVSCRDSTAPCVCASCCVPLILVYFPRALHSLLCTSHCALRATHPRLLPHEPADLDARRPQCPLLRCHSYLPTAPCVCTPRASRRLRQPVFPLPCLCALCFVPCIVLSALFRRPWVEVQSPRSPPPPGLEPTTVGIRSATLKPLRYRGHCFPPRPAGAPPPYLLSPRANPVLSVSARRQRGQRCVCACVCVRVQRQASYRWQVAPASRPIDARAPTYVHSWRSLPLIMISQSLLSCVHKAIIHDTSVDHIV